MKKGILITCLLGLFISTQSRAMLINGDFETGNLDGWNVFTTANGTNGNGGNVTMFDTNNDGVDSFAATFNVGQVSFSSGNPAGGGISQSVFMGAGNYSLSADIAMLDPSGPDNGSGGLFELLFDGIVVDSWDFGFAASGVPEYNMLSVFSVATEGVHDIAIRMTRSYLTNFQTPYQFVDNVSLITVPEPSSLALFVLALFGLGLFTKRYTH